jgi:SPP1 family predicted phage head-tail adaptor
MRAGRLSSKIEFQRSTESANTFGEMIQTWNTLFTCWAAVEPLKGMERFSAMQVQSDVDVRVTARWCKELSTLNTKDQVKYGNKLYDIKAVLNIGERDTELHVMCKEHL